MPSPWDRSGGLLANGLAAPFLLMASSEGCKEAPMLPSGSTYEDVANRFAWQIPEYYNIGSDVSDKWAAAQPNRAALTAISEDGTAEIVSFGALRDRSNATANLLEAHGLGQ